MFENQFENIFIVSHQFISLFNIFDEFNINSSKSHIEDYDIKNLVITSKIFNRIFTSRSNSNHLSASRIFQNFIYFVSKSIVLFYSFDEFDISLKVKFWIIISMKFLLTTSILKSFYLFESQFENIFIDHNKSIFFFCHNDNFNKSNQKISQHFSKIFKSILLFLFNIVSHISIRIIRFTRKSSRITSVCLANWLKFSTSMMKLITFRIQISNQFFKSLILNTSTRIQYWNHSFSSKTLRDHICFNSKESCFSRLNDELNIVSSETIRIFYVEKMFSLLIDSKSSQFWSKRLRRLKSTFDFFDHHTLYLSQSQIRKAYHQRILIRLERITFMQ